MLQKLAIPFFILMILLLIGVPVFFFRIEDAELQREVYSLFEIPMLETHYLYWIHHLFSFVPVFVIGILANGFLYRDRFLGSWIGSYLFLAAVYCGWDILFTRAEIWGFNEKYRLSVGLFPVEEVVWFLVIPVCSLFIYHIMGRYWTFLMDKRRVDVLHILCIVLVSVIYFLGMDKLYTALSCASVLIALVYSWLWRAERLWGYLISFMAILFPMIIFDGLLTGMFTREALVLYNPKEYLGIRLISIPFEDFLFGFSYIYGILLLGANEEGKRIEHGKEKP